MNLIIIDDEILTIQGIQKGVDWALLGFDHVFTAESAEEAMEYFSQYPIDIMLCDIEMGEMNGVELLEWVREKGMETECIFLTCHDEFSYAQTAIQNRANNYLLKPVIYSDLTRLLQQVSENLMKKEQKEQYEAYGRDLVKEKLILSDQTSKSKEQIVDEVKAYIRSHLSEDLNAELLAKEQFISADYLYRIFKKITGLTLGEFIMKERMFCAKELLRNPESNVVSVAISTGFNNYSYFSRVFKNEVGISPSAYRRKVLSGKIEE